ncbi:MAG TPA: EsaB/YukD family protein [Tepidisphaeraceae bacterium]|jgi:hypothetical protein|nr:EsaB/YukD family protein [Tepidisphaeraceae bacterium]
MASMQVRVLDVSGSRICDVEAPDDVTVDRILVLMVEKMGLPLNSPDGQLMSYKLHHRRTGTQLLDNQTLLGAGVKAGDELRLQPEITAGWWGKPHPTKSRRVGWGLPHHDCD